MGKGIFITGTDTGVGKTFVAAGLIRAMKEKDINVCPLKPVETGCKTRRGELIPEDAIKLLRASKVSEPVDLVNPYRLKNPLAPAVAADIEGVRINRKKIISAYSQLKKRYDITIVEGAGGIMVPVYKEYLFIDLIKDLNLPVLIVSRPGLGTINHTLLTIEAAMQKGLKVLGVIFNHSVKTKRSMSEKTNPPVIQKLGGMPVLGIVPFMDDYSATHVREIIFSIFNKIISGL
jgi:dethiobiotin synthetase